MGCWALSFVSACFQLRGTGYHQEKTMVKNRARLSTPPLTFFRWLNDNEKLAKGDTCRTVWLCADTAETLMSTHSLTAQMPSFPRVLPLHPLPPLQTITSSEQAASNPPPGQQQKTVGCYKPFPQMRCHPKKPTIFISQKNNP